MARTGSKGPDPPETVDLSIGAAKRAALRGAVDNWLTLAPLGVGVAAGAGALILGSSTVVLALLGAGLGIGVLHPLANWMLRGDRNMARYLEDAAARLAGQRQSRLAEIERELIACGSRVKGTEELVEQAARQCRSVRERIDRIREVLDLKLRPTELAYSRYSGTTEQVSLAILDNLQTVAHLLTSLPSDEVDTDGQLKRLERKQRRADEETRYQALLGRKRIYEEQIAKISGILGQNETAITDLDSAAATLAGAKTLRGEAEMTLEESRRYLEALVQRTRQFSAEKADPLEEKRT